MSYIIYMPRVGSRSSLKWGFWARFLRGGGGGRVQVRGNFHILTSKKKKKPLKGGGLNPLPPPPGSATDAYGWGGGGGSSKQLKMCKQRATWQPLWLHRWLHPLDTTYQMFYY